MDAGYFRKLFDYNCWANDRVLEQALRLPEADYFASVPGLSFDTLHATLAHVFVAEAVWLGRWRGRPLTGTLADARRMDRIVAAEVPDLASLIERWRTLEADRRDYCAGLTDADVQRPLSYVTMDGQQYGNPLGEQMAHVVNHGTQFRAEAAVALTSFSFSPGELDLIRYLRDLNTA